MFLILNKFKINHSIDTTQSSDLLIREYNEERYHNSKFMITDFSRFERWLKSKPIKKWTANLVDSSVDLDFVIHDFVQSLSVGGYGTTPAYGFSGNKYNYFLVFDIAKKNLIICGRSLRNRTICFKSICPIKFNN